MSFYIALLDNYLQDLRSAIGPFDTPDEAARWYDALVKNGIEGGMNGPFEPAVLGSWFALEVNCTPETFKPTGFGLSTVLGPYKSREEATLEMNREMNEAGDATFLRTGDHFVAPVKYLKEHSISGLQVAIFERGET